MGLQNDTSTDVEVVEGEASNGYRFGQATTSKIGFYGTTPQVQPTSASQAAITDNTGGTASATSGIQALTSSYNSAILSNNFATILAQTNAMRAALVSLGLIKGS